MSGFNFIPLMNIMVLDAQRQEMVARHVPTIIQTNAEDMTLLNQNAANGNQQDKKIAIAKLFRENEKEAIRGIAPTTLAIIPHVELSIVPNVFKNNSVRMVSMTPKMGFISNSDIGLKKIINTLQPEQQKAVAEAVKPVDPKIILMSDFRQKLRNTA